MGPFFHGNKDINNNWAYICIEMGKIICLIGAFDTKGVDYNFLREKILSKGHGVIFYCFRSHLYSNKELV